MTCFDVLLELQFNDSFYESVLDNYYMWYENRVNDVLNEKGIARITLSEFNVKSDLIRVLHKRFHFDYDTIDIGLENIIQYCKEMEVKCRVSTEAFGLAVAHKYFKEHEIPYMFRSYGNTINFSKSLDFVSWTALSEVFKQMYSKYTTRMSYVGTDTQLIVSIYDDFIAPELLRVKPYCRMEIFKAFTDWVIETFDSVVIEQKRVAFNTNPIVKVVGA